MRVVMFYHSLVSDWNHGNAHFLRGIVSEMLARGIDVDVYEPSGAWSVENLTHDHGEAAIEQFRAAYPDLNSITYDLQNIDLDEALDGADLVIVHEWNEPELVARIGKHRERNHGYCLFFHDTHHRAVTAPSEMARFDLAAYDGVLAFGDVIRDVYLQKGWSRCAWTWHEAADTRVFYPRQRDQSQPVYDLIWIGNWGDDERTAELSEYMIDPVRELGLRAKVYGVRYPAKARNELKKAGIEYGGWLPNFAVPQAFAQANVTVHIPRRPYTEKLPGIPTIRPFEALACGIPLVSAYWSDAEGLFSRGDDFLVARNGTEMTNQLERVLVDGTLRESLAAHGLQTIRSRHTCSDRVDELLGIYSEVERSKMEKVMIA
jgi:spore maturation protein CgeB